MRIKTMLCCLTAGPLLIGAAPPQQPLQLEPTSQWVIDYADNSCRLIRTFGQGADATKLEVESVAPNDMSMLVTGNPVRSSMVPPGSVGARFVPGQDPWFMGTAALAEGGQSAAVWSHFPLMPMTRPDSRGPTVVSVKHLSKSDRPPPVDLTKSATQSAERAGFLAHVSDLQIEPKRGHDVILDTGSLGDPIKVFDACMRDLVTSWGLDPDVQAKIVRPPWAPSPAAWFSSADYPAASLSRGEESEVSFRLIVDASGKVTNCTGLSHYDAPEFNTTVCNLLRQRARLSPAELADGTKVPSYFTDTVVFRIGP
jgi:hypothetical protein